MKITDMTAREMERYWCTGCGRNIDDVPFAEHRPKCPGEDPEPRYAVPCGDMRLNIYWTSETGKEMEQTSFVEFCEEQGFSEVWRAEIGDALRRYGFYRLAPQREGDVPLIIERA